MKALADFRKCAQPAAHVFVFLLAILTIDVRAEIDLTPIPSVRVLEGCQFPQLEFRDGAAKITYEVPKGWTYLSRDRATLALTPPNKDFVSARIKYIPATGKLVLDDAQLKRFRETAPSLLPPDSKLLTEPIITPNPLELDGHPTCEIDLSFVLHSQKFRTTVLFVDLGESQLRFSLTARTGDFESLHKEFQESWYTWQRVVESQSSSAQN